MNDILLYGYAVISIAAFMNFADRARLEESEVWFVILAGLAGATMWPLIWSYFAFEKFDLWLRKKND